MIVDDYTQDFDTIYATALLLFESIYGGEMLRLVGISLNNVKHVEELQQQISLFDHIKIQASKKEINETEKVIHRLNSSLPGLKIMKASDLIKQQSTIQKKYLENNE